MVRTYQHTAEGSHGQDLPAEVADYVEQHPGYPGPFYANPFTLLDAADTGDCITLTNLASAALRLLGVDARPCRAFTRNKVDPGDSTSWGWTRKLHPYHEDWFLGWPGNSFEGFLFVGELELYTSFPNEAWTVWPRKDVSVSEPDAKYLPIAVLFEVPVVELDWQITDGADVEWKPYDALPGVALQPFGATWSSDPGDDGEYTVQWDFSESTLKLGNGQWVTVSGNGTYSLSCSKGSILVDVVTSALLDEDAVGTARIVPARNLAPIP